MPHSLKLIIKCRLSDKKWLLILRNRCMPQGAWTGRRTRGLSDIATATTMSGRQPSSSAISSSSDGAKRLPSTQRVRPFVCQKAQELAMEVLDQVNGGFKLHRPVLAVGF